MKKRSTLLGILILCVLFFSACNLSALFNPSAISANWKGTISITNHDSALWFEDPDNHANDGKYTVEINFNFDTFRNPNNIIGGSLALNPVSHDASKRTITNPPYLISSGEFTVSDGKLSFNAEIVGKNFCFEGSVLNGILNGSVVKESINDTLTVVGSIDINAQ